MEKVYYPIDAITYEDLVKYYTCMLIDRRLQVLLVNSKIIELSAEFGSRINDNRAILVYSPLINDLNISEKNEYLGSLFSSLLKKSLICQTYR